MKLNKLASALFVFVFLFSGFAYADKQKVVIQVSTADPLTQKIALNNAVNVQKALGMDNVDVEIVAYGPGRRRPPSSSKKWAIRSS